MPAQTLSQVMLRDLVRPAGLTPIFGEQTRPEVLLEHLAQERRVIGEALQNVDALMDCAEAHFRDFVAGRISKDALVSELSVTIAAMKMELVYDEAVALAASFSD